ncbi:hypothetical protein LTR46_000326 [Exophiala xenobiotica]|nr:hypothetical protein LTR46_000326 [Exophiala xenobiotica]
MSKPVGPPFQIPDWRAAALEKRQSTAASIPEAFRLPSGLREKSEASVLLPSDPDILVCGILTPLDIEITSITSVSVLLSGIVDRVYTAIEVTSAFCKRAAIAHQCTSCLTEFMYERAMIRAKELDDYLAFNGRTIGMLHGLPVSLKDCFDVEDVNTNAGLVSWLPYIARRNSAIAQGLLNAGAVLFAKTNSSQALLMVESINNIFGVVKNPYNLGLSVGGSSGGEAALIAANGSILGSGSLKPSKERMPGRGVSVPRSGSESVNAGLGPLAKSVDGLELWLKAQLASEPWNESPGCLPMRWNGVEAQRPTKKLKVAVIWDDGIIRPTPPVTRAIQMVVDSLTNAGHCVVSLPSDRIFSLHRHGLSCTMLSNAQDGGRTVLHHIAASGEPVVPRTAVGSDASALTAEEIFANHLLRARLAGEYDELWRDFEMDAILAPATPHPANPHGQYISNSYATVYNMLDYVAGTIPVTTVDTKLDVADENWYGGEVYERIEPVRFPYDKGDKEMKKLYSSPLVFENAPVGVQILCRRLREEKCIGILKEIERLLEMTNEV